MIRAQQTDEDELVTLPIQREPFDWYAIGFPIAAWWITVRIERFERKHAEWLEARGDLIYRTMDDCATRIKISRRRRRASDGAVPSLAVARPGSTPAR